MKWLWTLDLTAKQTLKVLFLFLPNWTTSTNLLFEQDHLWLPCKTHTTQRWLEEGDKLRSYSHNSDKSGTSAEYQGAHQLFGHAEQGFPEHAWAEWEAPGLPGARASDVRATASELMVSTVAWVHADPLSLSLTSFSSLLSLWPCLLCQASSLLRARFG